MKNIQLSFGRKPGPSGIRGVAWCAHSNGWRATYRKDGQRIYLGHFPTKEEASLALIKKRGLPETRTETAVVSDEDYEYLSQFHWCAHKLKDREDVYAYRLVMNGTKKQRIYMHTEVACRMGLDLSGSMTDHANRNTLDNQRYNLRKATTSQNKMNQTIRKDNTTGVKGVSWNKWKRKYVAQISANGKRVWLECFDSLFEAEQKRNSLLPLYHGEFARTR